MNSPNLDLILDGIVDVSTYMNASKSEFSTYVTTVG